MCSLLLNQKNMVQVNVQANKDKNSLSSFNKNITIILKIIMEFLFFNVKKCIVKLQKFKIRKI